MTSVKGMTGRNSTTKNKRGRESPGKLSTTKQSKLVDYWLGKPPPLPTTNRFEAIATENDKGIAPMEQENVNDQPETPETTTQGQNQTSAPKIVRPPPIYVHGVEEIKPLRDLLEKYAPGGYTLKAMRGDDIKILVQTEDHYRVIIKQLMERKTDLHSYQCKSERTFRVVLKNLHQSTDPEDIKEELKMLGHTVKHISNIRHRVTKCPLPLFYIDLEKNTNNREIYDVVRFMHSVVVFEPPNKSREIVQCKNCQRYSHTKQFCNRPARCVKCDGFHSTKECNRSVRDNNVKCINCGENHPANYRGCRVHQELKQRLYPKLARKAKERERGNPPPPHATRTPVFTKTGQSYADIARNEIPSDINEINNTPIIINDPVPNSDMDELKNMMKQLMQQMGTLVTQMGTVMNLLTIIVGKDSKKP